jgi:hypothetical protein
MTRRALQVLITLTLLTSPALCLDAAPADVVVYYFHGDLRCTTCLMLEDMTDFVVRYGFPEEMQDGRLDLQIVNYQIEDNRHFEKDFSLERQSVVLASYNNDQLGNWITLDRIWELYDQPEAFETYIVQEVQQALDGETPDPSSLTE